MMGAEEDTTIVEVDVVPGTMLGVAGPAGLSWLLSSSVLSSSSFSLRKFPASTSWKTSHLNANVC